MFRDWWRGCWGWGGGVRSLGPLAERVRPGSLKGGDPVPTALRVTWTEGSRQSLWRLSLSLLSSGSIPEYACPHLCARVGTRAEGGVQCVDTRMATGGLRL